MNVSGEYLFDGPQPLVWDALLDPAVLAGVLPGCEKLERVGEDEYEGALKLKVGPVQGEFMGKVRLEDIQPPDSYTMRVDGRGAPGFVKATGHLTLEPAGDRTRVTYEGDAQVGGRLASVGQRLVESSAKAIIKQSLQGLNDAVRARAASGATGGTSEAAAAPPAAPRADAPAATTGPDVGPDAGSGAATDGVRPARVEAGAAAVPVPKAPSQTQYAAAIAREVAADMIPPWARYAVAALAAALLAYALYALLT